MVAVLGKQLKIGNEKLDVISQAKFRDPTTMLVENTCGGQRLTLDGFLSYSLSFFFF